MELIASFQVNHLDLSPGLYVSRRDSKGEAVTTTFDMRMTAPNREPVMDTPAMHTIEHLGATFLRGCSVKDDVVYFGPMGCRTGFYVIFFGVQTSESVYSTIVDMCRFILDFEGDIPGAKPEECGNYSEQNLNMAKYYIRRYLDDLTENKRFVYPE